MRNVFLITARTGSKRCINKNFRPFYKGLNLVQIAIDHAIQLRPELIDPIIVSTDALLDQVFLPEVKQQLKQIDEIHYKHPLNIHYLKRPDSLCTDKTPHIEVTNHFVEWFKNKGNTEDYLLTLTQPTSPFRSQEIWLKVQTKTKETGCCHHASSPGYPSGMFYCWKITNNRLKYCYTYKDAYVPDSKNSLHSIDIDTEEDFLAAQLLALNVPVNYKHTILPL